MTADEILLDTDRVCSPSGIREMLQEAANRAYPNGWPKDLDWEIVCIVSEDNGSQIPSFVRDFIENLPGLTSTDYEAIRAIYERSPKEGA